MVTGRESISRATWKKGIENPYTTDVQISPGIKFICPVCDNSIYYPNPNIHPIHGGHFQCHTCKDILHVPGAFFSESKPTDLKITAGVLVPISQWGEWYHSHPIFCNLLESQNTGLHDHYGLWAFCAKCYHQYQRTVLSILSLAQESLRYGDTFNFFNARSEESANDMKALTSGHCPSCGYEALIALMADIPDYVREAIETWKKTGSFPK